MLLMSLLLTQCSIDRTIHNLSLSELQTLDQFEGLERQSQVRISDPDEPGQKLWLCLTFVSAETERPIIKEQIKLFHTSSQGEYNPDDPSDESTARLNGTAYTDDQGRIFVQTILPGDYGSSSDNRHVHTTVQNARPQAYDIHFKQYTGMMNERFINGSDQHFLADLKQTEDGVLVAFLMVEVKNHHLEPAAMQRTGRSDD